MTGVVPPLLVVEGLRVGYGRGAAAVPAVDELSFSLGEGQILALVGESGCGKTTVARAIPGLVRARGRIRFEGRDLLQAGRADVRRARRRMGMVFQDPVASLNPRRRVLDIVAEPLRAAGVPGDHRPAVLQALARVGLASDGDPNLGEGSGAKAVPLIGRRPGELSGGQCQRVSLARALIGEPSLLICDEVTSALDAHHRASVLELLADARRRLGTAVLFITHDLSAAWQLADQVAVMLAGRLVELGPPDQLYQHPAHPYLRSLLDAVPTGARDRRPVSTSPRPGPAGRPRWGSGCAYRDRCPNADELCASQRPPLGALAPGPEPGSGISDRTVACHHVLR